MKVRLNLSTSPLESNRRFTLGATVLGVIAVLALALLSERAYSIWSSDRTYRARESALETQVSKLEQQRNNLASFFEDTENVKRRQRAAYLNSLIQQRAFPWIKIFMDLERILPEGAHVVSIEPKLVGDNVHLKFLVGATSDESKLKFLRALETSAQFSNLQLLTETRPTRPDLQADHVMLELEAQYSVI